MELDNSEAGKAARKAYRWSNNLCGYCEKGGHRVATCPNLAARDESKARVANTEVQNETSLTLYESKN